MRTLTCKHKTWGENWLYLRPYFKAFPVFNGPETCREYFLTIDLGIVEFVKEFIKWFLEKCDIVSKAAACKLIKFFFLVIAQSNSPLFLYAVLNGIKPL